MFQHKYGLTIPRQDPRTTHEEADMIIVQQCYGLIFDAGCVEVTIVSDDTNVFILACHYFPLNRPDVTVIMESTKACRTVIDIGKSSQKHESLDPSLLHTTYLTFLTSEEAATLLPD